MGRHPWSFTLRQFLEKVEQDFGAQRVVLLAVGPRGRADVSFHVREGSPENFAMHLGIDPDEELTPTMLRSLCVQLGIPPDVVGLEPEEPYYPEPDA